MHFFLVVFIDRQVDRQTYTYQIIILSILLRNSLLFNNLSKYIIKNQFVKLLVMAKDYSISGYIIIYLINIPFASIKIVANFLLLCTILSFLPNIYFHIYRYILIHISLYIYIILREKNLRSIIMVSHRVSNFKAFDSDNHTLQKVCNNLRSPRGQETAHFLVPHESWVASF